MAVALGCESRPGNPGSTPLLGLRFWLECCVFALSADFFPFSASELPNTRLNGSVKSVTNGDLKADPKMDRSAVLRGKGGGASADDRTADSAAMDCILVALPLQC